MLSRTTASNRPRPLVVDGRAASFEDLRSGRTAHPDDCFTLRESWSCARSPCLSSDSSVGAKSSRGAGGPSGAPGQASRLHVRSVCWIERNGRRSVDIGPTMASGWMSAHCIEGCRGRLRTSYHLSFDEQPLPGHALRCTPSRCVSRSAETSKESGLGRRDGGAG